MSNLFWLTDSQMARLQPLFPKSHCNPRIDDRRVLSGIWKRWGEKGIFAQMVIGLASEAAVPKTAMIDATYLKALSTAISLRSKKGGRTTKGAF